MLNLARSKSVLVQLARARPISRRRRQEDEGMLRRAHGRAQVFFEQANQESARTRAPPAWATHRSRSWARPDVQCSPVPAVRNGALGLQVAFCIKSRTGFDKGRFSCSQNSMAKGKLASCQLEPLKLICNPVSDRSKRPGSALSPRT